MASWGRFGAVLGPSWGRLGPSWVRLGDSWRLLESILVHLGASWGRLAASSKRLAASWGASSGDLEPKKTNPISDFIFGPKFNARKIKNHINSIGFAIVFGKSSY